MGHSAIAETRVALVIGNAAYHHAPRLANPANDARGVAAALRRLEFTVEEGIDLDTTGMQVALRKFARRLEHADVGLFFYAGHALQIRQKNYLAPIDAELERESDLIFYGIDLELVLRLLEESPRTSIVFLDACRDNPLARSLARRIGQTRSQMMGQGLADVQSGIGTLIAYATQPDNVALDGKGPNSPFTAALLQNIETPGVEIRQMLSRVRRAVIEVTEHRQVPWDHSSLTEDFYFNPRDLEAAQIGSTSAAAEAGSASSADGIVWRGIQASTNPTDFQIFLEKYPQSPFAPFAQSRLTTLAARPGISGPSTASTSSIEAPQSPPGGGQAIGTGEGQGAAALGWKAARESPAQRGDEGEAEELPDAALADLFEEAPSSGPASKRASVEVPITQTAPPSEPEQALSSKPEEKVTAALTGQASLADPSSLPGIGEQARAVEQALRLSRDDWRKVQRALNALNHPTGSEDGLPGQRTRAAVQAWQRALGSEPTGHLTPWQHARLLEKPAVNLAGVVTTTPTQPAEGTPSAAATAVPPPVDAAIHMLPKGGITGLPSAVFAARRFEVVRSIADKASAERLEVTHRDNSQGFVVARYDGPVGGHIDCGTYSAAGAFSVSAGGSGLVRTTTSGSGAATINQDTHLNARLVALVRRQGDAATSAHVEGQYVVRRETVFVDHAGRELRRQREFIDLTTDQAARFTDGTTCFATGTLERSILPKG